MSRFTHPYKLGAAKRLVFDFLTQLDEEGRKNVSAGSLYNQLPNHVKEMVKYIKDEMGDDATHITVVRRAIDDLAKAGYLLREKLGTEKSMRIDGGNPSGTVYNLEINEEAKTSFLNFYGPSPVEASYNSQMQHLEDGNKFQQAVDFFTAPTETPISEDTEPLPDPKPPDPEPPDPNALAMEGMFPGGQSEDAILGHLLRNLHYDAVEKNMHGMVERLRQRLQGETNGELSDIKESVHYILSMVADIRADINLIKQSPILNISWVKDQDTNEEEHEDESSI